MAPFMLLPTSVCCWYCTGCYNLWSHKLSTGLAALLLFMFLVNGLFLYVLLFSTLVELRLESQWNYLCSVLALLG